MPVRSKIYNEMLYIAGWMNMKPIEDLMQIINQLPVWRDITVMNIQGNTVLIRKDLEGPYKHGIYFTLVVQNKAHQSVTCWSSNYNPHCSILRIQLLSSKH